MADAVVGSVAVDVVPNARGWRTKMAKQVEPAAREIGERIGKVLADRIGDGMVKGLGEGTAKAKPLSERAGKSSGDSFGGKFARTARTHIEAALKALPEAKIGVATTAAEQKLKDLRAELLTLRDAEVGIDLSDKEALAKIAEVQAALEILSVESPNIQVKVDTGAAIAELAVMRAAVGLLNGGGDGGAGGGRGLSKMNSLIGQAGSGLAAFGKTLGPLGIAIALLVPIVATLGVALAGVTAALLVPIGAAGGGLTLFGVLAGFAVKNVLKTAKEIDRLKQKAAGLKDPAQRAAVLAGVKAMEESLTRSQRAFLKARDVLSGAFDKFTRGKAGDALLAPLAAGMNLLAKIMPHLEPIIISVSDALTDLLDTIGKKMDGPGFSRFIDKMAELAGPSIKTIAAIIADIGRAFGALFKAAGDTGTSALAGISRGFERLANHLNSTEGQEHMQKFFTWLKDEGPGILKSIGQISGYIGDAIEVLMKVGPPILKVIGMMASAISAFYSNVVGPTFEKVGAAFSMIGRIFTGVYNAAIGPVLSLIVRGIAGLMSAWAAMLRGLSKVPGFGWAKGAADAMSNAAGEARDLADGIRHIPNSKKMAFTTEGYKKAYDQITSLNALARGGKGRVHYTIGYGGGQTMADGGPVVGPGTSRSDSIPAWLSNGEFVVNAAAARANLGLLHRINAQKFANGGQVGGVRGRSIADAPTIVQNVTAAPGMNVGTFANATADRLLWALAGAPA